jgi:DNA invertase Pin-like site-specific DNA recombinase
VPNARLYLRASTSEQDAERARAALEAFADQHGMAIVASYTENESGSKLDRPELFRLLSDARRGDVLLVEQVDRLSRLNEADWLRLRAAIEAKGVRVIATDLPTSWMMSQATDEFTARMFSAINAMMLDMLAAIGRKDYTDRRRRQAEGIAKLKEAGGYKGRRENTARNRAIADMLRRGMSWSAVIAATSCSRATLSKIAGRMKDVAD